MKQKRVFGALALSGMATAFLSVGKTLQNGAAALPASHIFMILGFLALTKLWMTIWEACADRRLLRICMITGFLFSLCYCLGSAIQASIEVDYSSPWLYCNIVGMTVVFTAVLAVSSAGTQKTDGNSLCKVGPVLEGANEKVFPVCFRNHFAVLFAGVFGGLSGPVFL